MHVAPGTAIKVLGASRSFPHVEQNLSMFCFQPALGRSFLGLGPELSLSRIRNEYNIMPLMLFASLTHEPSKQTCCCRCLAKLQMTFVLPSQAWGPRDSSHHSSDSLAFDLNMNPNCESSTMQSHRSHLLGFVLPSCSPQ